MTKIHSLLSDLELDEELSINIKKRNIDNKFCYLEEWAEIYYKGVASREKKNKDLYSRKTYDEFIQKHLPKKRKIAFISLCCGDGRQEKETLEKLKDQDVTYFWVDSSKGMLRLADENLKDIKVKKTFICADILKKNFKEEIQRLTQEFDTRFFCFLWYTFPNQNQTEVTDSIYNILYPWDLIWFDVFIRPDWSQNSDFRIFRRYQDLLKNKEKIKSNSYILQSIGVPLENWEMKMNTEKEESLWAILLHFCFLFNKNTKISYRDEVLHIRKWQEINLLDVRAYEAEKLIKFFEESDFKLVDKEIHKNESELFKGQFLFKKS